MSFLYFSASDLDLYEQEEGSVFGQTLVDFSTCKNLNKSTNIKLYAKKIFDNGMEEVANYFDHNESEWCDGFPETSSGD